MLLIPLQPGVAFLYPLKTSENLLGFLLFSGGIEKQHRVVMGLGSLQKYCLHYTFFWLFLIVNLLNKIVFPFSSFAFILNKNLKGA